jgi:hypothetical protein
MKYSKEKVAAICNYIGLGMTQDKAASCAEISNETFHQWKKTKPEFSEALKKAYDLREARHLANINKAANKTWTASAWLLERLYPNTYALRHQITGPGGGAIPVAAVVANVDLSKVSDEVLEKLANLHAGNRSSQPDI